MISREQFKEIVETIQKQDKRELKFIQAIESYFQTSTWIEGNLYLDTLLNLLKYTIDPDEWINWWLYDSKDEKLCTYKGVTYEITTIDDLYDFIIKVYEKEN